MAAIILSLLAAALLSTVLLIPAGHLKQALGIPSAVCSAAAMGLYLQMRTVSGGPGTGIALVQLYLPCAVYGLVILGGAALAILGIGSVGGYPVVLIVGLVMLVIGSTRNAKGFGKLTALIGAVYNGATGFFSDILSYARLMALMLAGSVIAQVFNTLAAMPSSGGVTVVSMLIFIIIFLLGHLLNFGLNLLGCFVHDLRLQCLEFFGKFYVDGGKPFRPLEINTRYVDVENHNF